MRRIHIITFLFIISSVLGQESQQSDSQNPNSQNPNSENPNSVELSDTNSTEFYDGTSVIPPEELISPKAHSTTPVHTKLPVLQVEGIFGCSYPDDFLTRYKYCAKQSELFDNAAELDSDVLTYGVLDRAIVDEMMSNCNVTDAENCAKQGFGEKLRKNFLGTWEHSVEKYKSLQTCLQKNTEAMNRMCGDTTQVGRIVSGSAGLQLNLLSILIRAQEKRLLNSNVTETCLVKLAEAVHITAALYIKGQHYVSNSVLCWRVMNEDCSPTCSAFASELSCLLHDCKGLTLTMFQQFGIWQWYYLNPNSASKRCSLDDSKCSVEVKPHDTVNPEKGSALGNLFHSWNWDWEKVEKIEHQLEDTFHLPFNVLLAITVSGFAAFLATITGLCLWRYGFLCRKRRTLRYSRLNAGELRSEETKSLTTERDFDDLE